MKLARALRAGPASGRTMSQAISIIIGDDPHPKEKKLASLKEQCLTSSDALKLDYDSLDAHKLSPRILQETLLALPAVADRRLVVVRNCQQLSKPVKDVLVAYAAAPFEHVFLVLEAARLTSADPFIKKFLKKADIFDFSSKGKPNVFDMTKAISARQTAEALRILAELLTEGDQPLHIMGALVWFWREIKNRLSPARYREGLQFLQDADLNIKRSRLYPDYALELVVVQLTSLLAHG